MRARGLLARIVALTMFHLTLVGPDELCADHAAASAADAASAPHASVEHAEHAEHQSDSRGHHSTHTSTRCCDAVSSCTLIAVSERATESVDPLQLADAPTHAASRLISRVLGPEPPPPKV